MADVLSVIADVLNQDKRQKKEQAKMMREVQKKLKEKGSEEVAEEEGDKEDYMKFFAGKLKKYGVKSPSELSDEDKKKFFNEIEKDWKHDSSEEVEVEKKEEDLGKRVKARMEAEEEDEDEGGTVIKPDSEDELEDEDEDPVGEPEEDDEPSEEELDKLADLVVQKIKDKADDEEEEEKEPDATEAESGKEEKIEVNPKMESVRNPHARATWEEALRQVYAVNEESVEGDEIKEASDTSWIDPHAKKIESKWKSMNKSARKKWLQTMADMATDKKTKQAILDDVLDDFGLTEDYTDLRGDGDEGTTTSDPDKDYGLHQFSDPKYVPAYTDQSFQTAPDKTGIGQNLGDKQSGTPKKAKGQATAAKAPAKVDAKGGMDKPAVGTKSDTPDKAVGKAAAAKIAPRVTTKDGVATQKEEVELESVQLDEVTPFGSGWRNSPDRPEVLIKKALDDAGIKMKSKRGKIAVARKDKPKATHTLGKLMFDANGYQPKRDKKTVEAALDKFFIFEEVELDERAKGDSIEGPAKGKKHKCPTYVKKEGYGYGKNISHSLSENVVDKMNIYWYDSKEVSYMMPINEVEIVEAGYHSEEGHTAKFKSTKKIAEELSKLSNPFETSTTTEVKITKKEITEKRSVSFARKFYQKGEK
jgi:hypothetical protein